MLMRVECVYCVVIFVVVFLSSVFLGGVSFWICFIAILMALDWLSLVFVCNCCLLVLVVSCLFSGSQMRCGAGGFGAGFVSFFFARIWGVHSRCRSILE